MIRRTKLISRNQLSNSFSYYNSSLISPFPPQQPVSSENIASLRIRISETLAAPLLPKNFYSILHLLCAKISSFVLMVPTLKTYMNPDGKLAIELLRTPTSPASAISYIIIVVLSSTTYGSLLSVRAVFSSLLICFPSFVFIPYNSVLL